jgi:dTDP-4-amino-4,6-dideoxygalactose transaminase
VTNRPGPPFPPADVEFAPWPSFDEVQIEAVARVLRSGKVSYWTGDEGRQFEVEYARACGCRHGIALSNGTVALDCALHALEIPSGAEVITTPRTFIASASAAVLRGCIPVFADVDADSGNLTASTIEAALTPRTRAIVAVHLAGWPCDMDPIMALAGRHGLKVIEDCAQANGALYHGRPVGSLGHAGAFSFCQDKIITTGGEGGFLSTDDPEVWRRAWEYKDHGKNWEAIYQRRHGPGFRWLHESFGTNGRMTEMQAVLGRLQLARLPEWGDRRRRNMGRLLEAFRELPGLRVPVLPPTILHAAYKAYVYVRPEALQRGWDRDRILCAVQDTGVPCFSGTCSEIYREQAFAKAGLEPAAPLPVALELGDTSLMFPVHPTLSEEALDAMIRAVRRVMAEASR